VRGSHGLSARRRRAAATEFDGLHAQSAAHGRGEFPDEGSRYRLALHERYVALHLNDFDLAANNGGWQWAASTGCDAQPYFRIFNPVTQSKRFDADGQFVRRYVPELAGLSAAAIHAPWLAAPGELAAAGIELGRSYPVPIVDHEVARRRTLARYAVGKALR
jgi:deoxyribodipyrimidine photo-lyase